jgi:hypothetical protein
MKINIKKNRTISVLITTVLAVGLLCCGQIVAAKSLTGYSSSTSPSVTSTYSRLATLTSPTPPVIEPGLTLKGSYSKPHATHNFSGLAIVSAFGAVFTLLMMASLWRVFTKAGRHGWAALIPIYNIWVIYEIGGKPGWMVLILFIPVVNLFALFVFFQALIMLADDFDKGTRFAILGLFFFSFIGWPILAFGKARYLDSERYRDFTNTATLG